jgi:hypothetical protein
MVLGIIPECRSASFETGVQLRRNPQASDYFFVRQSINRCSRGSAAQGYSPVFPPLNRWEATSEPASTIRLAVRPKTLCALRILSFFSIRQSLFGQAINGE